MLERAGGALSAIIGIVGWVAASATENVTLIGAGSFTAFALAGFGLMWRSWAKENARVTRALERETDRADRLDYQRGILRELVDQHGIHVPGNYHAWPPTPRGKE